MGIKDLTEDEIARIKNASYRYVGDVDVPYIWVQPFVFVDSQGRNATLSTDDNGRIAEFDKLGIRFLPHDSEETNGYKQTYTTDAVKGWEEIPDTMLSNQLMGTAVSADAKTSDGKLFIEVLRDLGVPVENLIANRFAANCAYGGHARE